MAAFRANQEMETGSVQSGTRKWQMAAFRVNQEMETGSVQSGTREWQMAAFRVELGNGKWQRLE